MILHLEQEHSLLGIALGVVMWLGDTVDRRGSVAGWKGMIVVALGEAGEVNTAGGGHYRP